MVIPFDMRREALCGSRFFLAFWIVYDTIKVIWRNMGDEGWYWKQKDWF